MPAYQIEKCSCWLTHVYTCTYKRDFLKWGKLCLCRQRNSVNWLIRLIFNLLAVLETIITYDWSLICCIIGKLNGTVRIHNTLRKMGLNICVFKPAGQANTVYIEGMQCRQLTTETLTKRVPYEQTINIQTQKGRLLLIACSLLSMDKLFHVFHQIDGRLKPGINLFYVLCKQLKMH